MANTLIPPDQMARELMAHIRNVAKATGISEVDIANQLSRQMFYSSEMYNEAISERERAAHKLP